MILLPVAVLLVSAVPLTVQAQVWRCETDSGVPLYQNSGGARCKPLDLPVITTLPGPVLPKPAQPPSARGAAGSVQTSGANAPAGGSATTGPGQATVPPGGSASGAATFPRVDPAEQRARDLERRRILTEELRREESRLSELRGEFREGEPERRGDERNYQKYLDRVQRLKDDIARTESAVASLKRELAGLKD